MSGPETDTPPSTSVTSEEVARQIKAETDPLTQQLAHLCELMQEIDNVQARRPPLRELLALPEAAPAGLTAL